MEPEHLGSSTNSPFQPWDPGKSPLSLNFSFLSRVVVTTRPALRKRPSEQQLVREGPAVALRPSG